MHGLIITSTFDDNFKHYELKGKEEKGKLNK